jgi:hypothetical protein
MSPQMPTMATFPILGYISGTAIASCESKQFQRNGQAIIDNPNIAISTSTVVGNED